jgi:dUTP pyrophosphatase
MNIKKLSPNAIIPTRGGSATSQAAGYDLYSTEEYELKIGERKAFKTDISMAIPVKYYGRIAPRSGLAVKKGIDVMAGVVDSDYRGEILVVLINLGQDSVQIKSGDKIAQIIFEQHYNPEFSIVDDLDSTDRGVKGFGSTDEPKPVKIPSVVSKALEDMYKGTKYDVPSDVKYIDKIKEK